MFRMATNELNKKIRRNLLYPTTYEVVIDKQFPGFLIWWCQERPLDFARFTMSGDEPWLIDPVVAPRKLAALIFRNIIPVQPIITWLDSFPSHFVVTIVEKDVVSGQK